jgi:hypothetical protein
MAEHWVTIAEAAAALKIHPRTVERRAAAGKIESRRNDDGQVQVFLNLPDREPVPPEPVPSEAFETVKEMADRQVDIAAGSASALVRAAQEQAMRAEHQLDLARQESGRYRRETQMAMALLAVMLLLVIVAVGWCTHTITDARDHAAMADVTAHMADVTARTATAELVETRTQLAQATEGRAKAEGELTAYKAGLATVVEQTRPRPTTQPATLFGRLTQAFAGD